MKAVKGNDVAIRSVSFAPTDEKFATACDDQTVSIWDFGRCTKERVFMGTAPYLTST